MDRGAWEAMFHGITEVLGTNLATVQQIDILY